MGEPGATTRFTDVGSKFIITILVAKGLLGFTELIRVRQSVSWRKLSLDGSEGIVVALLPVFVWVDFEVLSCCGIDSRFQPLVLLPPLRMASSSLMALVGSDIQILHYR
jgi:hypothetical protein